MIPDEDDTKNQDDNAADAPRPSQDEVLAGEYRRLTAAGFSKQQIAQQLSVKHNVTVDDMARRLDVYDKDEQNS
jgi:hypothetical protein